MNQETINRTIARVYRASRRAVRGRRSSGPTSSQG